MKDFIETRIIAAIRKLLVERANEFLRDMEFVIPLIEFGGCGHGCAVVPVIVLSTCEQSEKERIIRLDAYSLTITFELPEAPESELHCYAYSAAVNRAIEENPTLGGIVDRAVITGKKYVSPKKQNCGENWQVIITLRLTVEENEQVTGNR